MTCLAISRVSAKSPLFNAGWPQQGWAEGTSTLQPASCNSFTAAKPTLGRNRSMRHVANKPTRGLRTGEGAVVAASVIFDQNPGRGADDAASTLVRVGSSTGMQPQPV